MGMNKGLNYWDGLIALGLKKTKRILVLEYELPTEIPSGWSIQQIIAAAGLRPPLVTRIEERS